MNLTLEQIKACTLCTEANAEKYTDALNSAMEKYEINTFLRQAHFLSQLGHESMGLVYTTELASGEAYEGRGDMGNTHEGDGKRYKGRGFIQITGRFNYISYGSSIGIDFEDNPELLADIPYCADSAAWFWGNHSLNILADQNKAIEITRRINGGSNGLPDRMMRLRKCKQALGLMA